MVHMEQLLATTEVSEIVYAGSVVDHTLDEIVQGQHIAGIAGEEAISEYSAQGLRSRKMGSSRCREAYVDCQQKQGSPRYR